MSNINSGDDDNDHDDHDDDECTFIHLYICINTGVYVCLYGVYWVPILAQRLYVIIFSANVSKYS